MMSCVPALALGNAVVIKPHQHSPVSGGGLVAKLFEDAGLPAGLLNILVTDIAEIGDALIEHPVPSVISFAGSDRVGRHVAMVAASHFKRTILELSGNSTFIVLDDVKGDALDYAVEAAVASRFIYQGQVCMAANRILVDRTVEAEFTERFVAAVGALKVGDPSEPGTHIGPLISGLHVDTIEAVVRQALEEGATALLRGRSNGNLVEPTVLAGLEEDSPLMRHEIFGPVALLVPFDGDDEAVRLANNGPYGLSGAVHTADVERGVRLGRRIVTGMVHVNNSTVLQDATIPFGGEGNSGLGRLGGEGSIAAFTTEQWISVQDGRARFPL
jgi:aldehyde dehydrogenase (NAD+)